MGMFDYVYYKGEEYQSKDTPHQCVDKYKIEEEQVSGQLYLWHESYKAEWVEDEQSPFGHTIKTSDHRWEHCSDFDGAINFYRSEDKGKTWIEYHSLFMNGVALKMEKINNE